MFINGRIKGRCRLRREAGTVQIRGFVLTNQRWERGVRPTNHRPRKPTHVTLTHFSLSIWRRPTVSSRTPADKTHPHADVCGAFPTFPTFPAFPVTRASDRVVTAVLQKCIQRLHPPLRAFIPYTSPILNVSSYVSGWKSESTRSLGKIEENASLVLLCQQERGFL